MAHPEKDRAQTNGGALSAEQALPAIVRADAQSVEIPCHTIDGDPSNREVTTEDAEEMAESLGQHGQINDVIVAKLPSGRFLMVEGHRRLAGARLRGERTIRARVLDHVPDETEKLAIRVVTAMQTKSPDRFQMGLYIFNYQNVTGLDQTATAAFFGFKSQSAVSKLTAPFRNGCPELIEAMKSGDVKGAAGAALAAMTHEEQRAILPLVKGKKRDRALEIISGRKGKPCNQKKAKPKVYRHGDTTVTVVGDVFAAVKSLAAKLTEAVKKLERDGTAAHADAILPDLLA